MPVTKTILTNQVLTDIAIGQYSSIESLFVLALANGIGITDEPAVGTVIALPAYEVPKQVLPDTQIVPVKKTKGSASVMLLQTLVDISIQETGDIGGLFELALLNGVGITDDLQAGDKMLTPIPLITLRQVVKLLQQKPPASGITGGEQQPGGVGYMQIQTSFKVS